ncbi:MAG: GntR family transcriptional regulator [Actinobacteria bacterium]|nr:GntR family transcriptional regulator [Actinomycetota bacterium]
MSRTVSAGQPSGNTSVTVSEAVRRAIVEGRVAPGERLKEEELARGLGISRTPVREALLILQAEGLVDAAPNRGATVRAHTADDLEELYELRALLEGYAARRAASRIDDSAIARLAESCERFARLKGAPIEGIVAENATFHGLILELADSERLAAMVRSVVQLPLVYRSYAYYSPEQTAISLHYHRQITAALARRDAERAELVMKEHVYEARDLLVAHVRTVVEQEAPA